MQAADIRFTLYPVGFIISVVFLAATLAAGWLLPASHHVLHWRCQTHHVTCLMLGDLLMAIIQLAGDSLHGVSCKALGESLCFTINFYRSFIPNRSYPSTYRSCRSSMIVALSRRLNLNEPRDRIFLESRSEVLYYPRYRRTFFFLRGRVVGMIKLDEIMPVHFVATGCAVFSARYHIRDTV